MRYNFTDMTLISSNEATEKLNASSKNFKQLLEAGDPILKEEVITQLAQVCLEEIENAQLGWGHSFKKFFATTFTYTSVLAAPILTMIGSIWYFLDKIQGFSELHNIKNLAYAGTGFGTVVLADYAIGKIFGIRPVTAILLVAYDAYRNGAKTLAKGVEKGYNDHEEALKMTRENSKKILIDELKKTYLGIAIEMTNRTPEELTTLQKQMPFITIALAHVGLSKLEICQILSPVVSTLLIQKSA